MCCAAVIEGQYLGVAGLVYDGRLLPCGCIAAGSSGILQVQSRVFELAGCLPCTLGFLPDHLGQLKRSCVASNTLVSGMLAFVRPSQSATLHVQSLFRTYPRRADHAEGTVLMLQ